jgi:hypothetical protein
MSHRKIDLGIPCSQKSAKVVLAVIALLTLIVLGAIQIHSKEDSALRDFAIVAIIPLLIAIATW